MLSANEEFSVTPDQAIEQVTAKMDLYNIKTDTNVPHNEQLDSFPRLEPENAILKLLGSEFVAIFNVHDC